MSNSYIENNIVDGHNICNMYNIQKKYINK